MKQFERKSIFIEIVVGGKIFYFSNDGKYTEIYNCNKELLFMLSFKGDKQHVLAALIGFVHGVGINE